LVTLIARHTFQGPRPVLGQLVGVRKTVVYSGLLDVVLAFNRLNGQVVNVAMTLRELRTQVLRNCW
jgi:hypothetical protein